MRKHYEDKFVQRDDGGRIVAVFACEQPYAKEQLRDTDKEIVQFYKMRQAKEAAGVLTSLEKRIRTLETLLRKEKR